MSTLPIIKIEIEGLRRQVCSGLLGINDEINKYVMKSLEKQMTEEWVIVEIDNAVKECLKKAIEGIANDYRMRSAMTELVSNVIAEKLSGGAA